MTQPAGPSYRHIVDLSDMESSLFLNPLGQSGNPLSKHYDDFLRAWSEGGYLQMLTNGYAVAASTSLSRQSDK
jgi:penicillin amidase